MLLVWPEVVSLELSHNYVANKLTVRSEGLEGLQLLDLGIDSGLRFVLGSDEI